MKMPCCKGEGRRHKILRPQISSFFCLNVLTTHDHILRFVFLKIPICSCQYIGTEEQEHVKGSCPMERDRRGVGPKILSVSHF